MMGSPLPEAGSFGEALRLTREALEKAERELGSRAEKTIRDAEQRAQEIIANAEAEGARRAEALAQEAEARAASLPTERLVAAIKQLDEMYTSLAEIRHELRNVLAARQELGPSTPRTAATQPAAAASTAAQAPEDWQSAAEVPAPPDVPEPQAEPAYKPGALTIVRGLRAQMIEDAMGGQGGGAQPASQPETKAPEPEPEAPAQPDSWRPQQEQTPPPSPQPPQQEERRRWPFG